MDTNAITELSNFCKIYGILNLGTLKRKLGEYTLNHSNNINEDDYFASNKDSLDVEFLLKDIPENDKYLDKYNENFEITEEVKEMIFRPIHKCICGKKIEILVFIKNYSNEEHIIILKNKKELIVKKNEILLIGSSCIGKFFMRSCGFENCNICILDSLKKCYCQVHELINKENKKNLLKVKCEFKNCVEYIKKKKIYCDKHLQMLKKEKKYSEMICNFGKYRGRRFKEVPENYVLEYLKPNYNKDMCLRSNSLQLITYFVEYRNCNL